jgi:uncharacterized protein YkwD
MKTFYQILIIIFILFSLFILRDDVKSVLNNISSRLDIDVSEVTNIKNNKEIQLEGKTETPGALRVLDNYINDDNTKLSKDNVIVLTNKARNENGQLPSLLENNKLNLSAQKKLQDMFNGQYFEHISPSNVSVGDLGDQVGYEYILIGENLALGNFEDDLALVDAWMASPGHRANILNGNYTEIGVAVGKGVYEGKNVWMAVQHFGAPKSVCPTVDKVLQGIIGLNQDKIVEMEQELDIRREKIDEKVLYEGSTYFEQVEKYNSLVNIYNNLIKETKEKIDEYNNQIRTFNSCISSKQ